MNIPVFQPIILRHHIKSDGSVNIKVRITHRRKVKYIPTTEIAHKGDYNPQTLLIRSNSINLRLTKFIEKLENALSKLDSFKVSEMEVGQLIASIEALMKEEEQFVLDFFEWGEKVAATKPKYSAANYRTALRSFERFLGKSRMDISEVTSSLMRSYETYLVKKHGKDARAVSLYTAALAYIHSEARKQYNNEELNQVRVKNPFDYYQPPKQKPAPKRTIDRETVQKLIDMRNNLSELHKLAVDVFLLSFCLMGTNVPDLYEATRKDDVICYNRTKTRDRRHDDAEMQIRLEPVCGKLIEDMADPSGERAFMLHKRYSFYKSIADKANDRLKEVAKMIGVPSFTMYSARHTWASIAYSIGIPKSLINDCLCHVDPDMAVTDIYIEKDWSILWEANRRVLESFDWK